MGAVFGWENGMGYTRDKAGHTTRRFMVRTIELIPMGSVEPGKGTRQEDEEVRV